MQKRGIYSLICILVISFFSMNLVVAQDDAVDTCSSKGGKCCDVCAGGSYLGSVSDCQNCCGTCEEEQDNTCASKGGTCCSACSSSGPYIPGTECNCCGSCQTSAGYCGDGSCNNAETQSSCPSDCGTPPPVVGSCDSCISQCASSCGDYNCIGTDGASCCHVPACAPTGGVIANLGDNWLADFFRNLFG